GEPGAPRIGRARPPGPTSARTAPGRRTPGATTHRAWAAHLRQFARLFAQIVVDPFRGQLVKVPAQDLLVVEREAIEHPRLEHDLGCFEGVAVLEAVLLERHGGDLVRKALARSRGRYEVEV